MKYYERMKEAEKLQNGAAEVPWEVWTSFWEKQPFFGLHGDKVSFDGDYKSLREVRESLEWIVDQFGGKIKWKK